MDEKMVAQMDRYINRQVGENMKKTVLVLDPF